VNHELCDQYGNEVLAQFGLQNAIRYSQGKFDGNWKKLDSSVDLWWKAYKDWERKDTLADAFKEQRLTVKGTTTMDLPIEARAMPKDPSERYNSKARWGNTQGFGNYKIVKTNASILERLKPEVFVPLDKGASSKTEKGYHDLSGLLLNPQQNISAQQYKGRGEIDPNQVYVFMPLAYALDQAVFHNINTLAKAQRENGPFEKAFYEKVRDIRSKMTRIKLLAEHDMAVSFVMVGHTNLGRPKFEYTLLEKTDVSQRDVDSGVVPKDTLHAGLTEIKLEDALKTGLKLKGTDLSNVTSILKEVLRPLLDKELLPPEEFRKLFAAEFGKPMHKNKLARITNLEQCKELLLQKAAPKMRQIKTTPGIWQARQQAAINYHTLVLGEMMRYAEVTIAYRQHAGPFPKFATFDGEQWCVGTVNAQNVWTANDPTEVFADRPV
jgi:hypothetical protein